MDLSLLKQVPLFQGLNQPQLEKIGQISSIREYPVGAQIFQESEFGDAMFVVLAGRVRISKQVSGIGEEALAILDPGQYFGEMALIEEGPRSADAIAHTSCQLWVFSRDAMDQLMFTDKDLAYVLLWTFVRTLCERLREANDKIKAFFAMSQF